jgi:hypothetical protein
VTPSSTRHTVTSFDRLESLAAEAVAVLGILPSLKKAERTLLDQIEECDRFAGTSNHALFIVTTMPLANSFIHYAADLDALRNARQWASERWPGQDPSSMLATLTLMYMIQQGVRVFGADPAQREKWDRIYARIESLLQYDLAAVA